MGFVYYGDSVSLGICPKYLIVLANIVALFGAYMLILSLKNHKHKILMPPFFIAAILVGTGMPLLLLKYSGIYYCHHFFPSGLVYNIPTDQSLVALTFDDGPEKGRTNELLDVLKAHHAHASFFLIGEKIAGNEEVVRRLYREGHSIGNHSWSHRRFKYISDKELLREIESTNHAIETVIGRQAFFVRPPGGNLSLHQKNLIQSCFSGKICMWNRSTIDYAYNGTSPTKIIVNNATAQLVEGDVILAHDCHISPQTLDALLSECEKKGYRVVSIEELLNSQKKCSNERFFHF